MCNHDSTTVVPDSPESMITVVTHITTVHYGHEYTTYGGRKLQAGKNTPGTSQERIGLITLFLRLLTYRCRWVVALAGQFMRDITVCAVNNRLVVQREKVYQVE